MSRVIFSTVHGSHLYGLAHDMSDMDIYTVTTSRKHRGTQRIREDVPGEVRDVTEIGLDAFLERANSGSHQAVEALFSRRKIWADRGYQSLIENHFICGPEVFSKYERTIKKFCYGDFKRRRHAVRLSFNLHALRMHGRFNPEMTQPEILWASGAANAFEGGQLYDRLLG